MKKIIRNHVWKADENNENQIKRYFEQEKNYINSGHKNFGINFERKIEKSESQKPFELNILDYNDMIDFYQSKRDMLGDLWEDDGIILEASLKHLQIIQSSLRQVFKFMLLSPPLLS